MNFENDIGERVCEIFEELVQASAPKKGDIVVLGASTSEILGRHIGKAPSEEIGRRVVAAAMSVAEKNGLYLAVQCCEHLNRALIVERACATSHNLEIVSARPVPAAGGACAAAAWEAYAAPVAVERITAVAGVDIGDTNVGMHVKFVQIPHRPTVKSVGAARVTCLRSRPKLIGGERAKY